MGRTATAIGTIRVRRHAGRMRRMIKVLDSRGCPIWRPYSRHLWESHHGCLVPPDRVVVHADGDRLNDAIENLELMSRGDILFEASEQEQVESRRRRRQSVVVARVNSERAISRRLYGTVLFAWYVTIERSRYWWTEPFARAIDARSAALAGAAGLTTADFDAGLVRVVRGRDVPALFFRKTLPEINAEVVRIKRQAERAALD